MTVIAGYVPTELGRAVLEAAIEETARRGSKLLIVNSSTGAAYADPGLASQEALQRAADSARDRDVRVEVKQVDDARAVEETLLAEADRSDAELLVIGLRTRSRTGKFLLGSTAQTVLLRAPCNVLAVKEPARAGH